MQKQKKKIEGGPKGVAQNLEKKQMFEDDLWGKKGGGNRGVIKKGKGGEGNGCAKNNSKKARKRRSGEKEKGQQLLRVREGKNLVFHSAG